MNNTIVTPTAGGIWAEFEALRTSLASDIQKARTTQKVLDSFGLGSQIVELARDSKYALYRDQHAAYVRVLSEGASVDPRKYTIRLEAYRKNNRVLFERYRAFFRDIECVPGFVEHLAPTGIWASINTTGTRPKCYLYRISFALANRGENIFWDGSLPEECDEQLEVMHLNRISYCDVAKNLRVSRQAQHRAYDTRKSEQAKSRAFRRMLWDWRCELRSQAYTDSDWETERMIDDLTLEEIQEMEWSETMA